MGRPGGRFGKNFYKNLNDEGKTAYKNYLDGVTTHKMDRPASGAARKRGKATVYPFGKQPADAAAVTTEANRYVVSMTAQAKAIAALYSSLTAANDFGFEDPATIANINASTVYNALARVTLADPTDEGTGTRKSVFSARDVKTLRTRSGSIPIGRVGSAGNWQDDYVDRISNISAGMKGITLTAHKLKTITFVPEYWEIDSAGLENIDKVSASPISY
jgi:hypothetical protein